MVGGNRERRCATEAVTDDDGTVELMSTDVRGELRAHQASSGSAIGGTPAKPASVSTWHVNVA